jgi:hypothetical protein
MATGTVVREVGAALGDDLVRSRHRIGAVSLGVGDCEMT